MANYDASVRVNTKVENSDLGKLQKDFDKLEAKLDSLYRKGDKLEALGVDKQSRQWKSLQYDVAQTEMALEDVKDRIQEVNSLSTDKQVGGFEKIQNASKKCFKSIQSGTKKSNGLFSTMGSRLKGIALSLLVFNWITKGFNAMVSAMKEGFKNLAQYSDEYNESMSALKSQTAQLKNGLAAAFEPIVNMAIPYLTQLVSWLNTAADSVAQFLAILQGKSTYTKAKKQTIDYAKSLDTASKSAKGALAAFDELNVLSQNDSGNSDSGATTGAEAFETAEVETGIVALAESIMPLRDAFSGIFDDVDCAPLLESFERLKTACEPFTGYIYDALLWFAEDVLTPLSEWTIEDALPAFLDTLSETLNTLDAVVETVKPGLEELWNKVLVPLGQFSGDAIIWVLDTLKNTFGDLSDVFEEKGEKITSILSGLGTVFMTLWEVFIKPQIQYAMGTVETLFKYIVKIVGDLIDVLAGIVDFIVGILTGDIDKALDGLVDIFKGAFNLVMDIVEGAVNAIINGLNKISINIPDWVPEIGGETFGFNIQEVKLPHLAHGAVIQGGRPFAAILGDQRFGQTNIETPLNTMVDAFKQAMKETGGGTAGEITFVAQLDGRTLFKETVKQNQIFKKSTGASAFG